MYLEIQVHCREMTFFVKLFLLLLCVFDTCIWGCWSHCSCVVVAGQLCGVSALLLCVVCKDRIHAGRLVWQTFSPQAILPGQENYILIKSVRTHWTSEAKALCYSEAYEKSPGSLAKSNIGSLLWKTLQRKDLEGQFIWF